MDQVSFSIDALFLDNASGYWQVIGIARALTPGDKRLVGPHRPCAAVLEVPAGAARGVRIGDYVRMDVTRARKS